MRAIEFLVLNENAVGDLEKDLKNPHSYDAIDHMMQSIAKKHGITGKELHDRFVKKHGQVPDDWIKDRLEEDNGIIEGKYNANPATYNLPRRPLNVPELIKRGAIFVVDPHGDNGWEPDAEGFSLVTLYNVAKGGWPAEARQHLKPSMYKVAAKALNQQGPGTMMYDGKYNQILWSIKKLGIPEEVAFLDTVAENFADGKVKGKSRPGRVKRAGASCNGSVTDLRARAKRASGEKAKMYHWCANMKSGKNK